RVWPGGAVPPGRVPPAEAALRRRVADRAAASIAHGRTYERERLAREEAERATVQLQAVLRVTDAALAYLREEELLQELLHRVSEFMGIDTVAILLLEGD